MPVFTLRRAAQWLCRHPCVISLALQALFPFAEAVSQQRCHTKADGSPLFSNPLPVVKSPPGPAASLVPSSPLQMQAAAEACNTWTLQHNSAASQTLKEICRSNKTSKLSRAPAGFLIAPYHSLVRVLKGACSLSSCTGLSLSSPLISLCLRSSLLCKITLEIMFISAPILRSVTNLSQFPRM